jgi:phosphoenolpyruvate carboxylase
MVGVMAGGGLERRIPRTMSSQHPDNASVPAWANGEVIAGEAEVREAYEAYSTYGCEEVMWDAEGKDIDPHVLRKLLSSYPDFFKERLIGRDIFLTFRIPNPYIEEAERKVFLEALQSIPRHNDVGRVFYGDDHGPCLFEVILPFTTSHIDLVRVKEAYKRAVVEPIDKMVDFRGHILREMVGDVLPKDIEVIPLIEDFESLIAVSGFLQKYIELFSPKYLRVFIARSDPALMYGFIPATIMAKIVLAECSAIEDRMGIQIYPIIGTGCLPFRGHNSPSNVEKFVEEYVGVWTVTVQSGFKYDYKISEAVEAVSRLNRTLPKGRASSLEGDVKELAISATQKLSQHYRECLELVAQTVSQLSTLVPPRRSRKLHIGLFSYSRQYQGVPLPRAIPFTAIFYTLGLPPEIIGLRGLRTLSEEEYDIVRELHRNMLHDLNFVGGFLSWENLSMLAEGGEALIRLLGSDFVERFIPRYMEDVAVAEEMLGVRTGARTLCERKYTNTAENFLISLLEGDLQDARSELVRAGRLRKSLG